jgi:hypothetical protein
VLGLPGFTAFLQVLYQDYAALRSSFALETRSYAQKCASDGIFRGFKAENRKSLNS